jgi:hypothetical protein
MAYHAQYMSDLMRDCVRWSYGSKPHNVPRVNAYRISDRSTGTYPMARINRDGECISRHLWVPGGFAVGTYD